MYDFLQFLSPLLLGASFTMIFHHVAFPQVPPSPVISPLSINKHIYPCCLLGTLQGSMKLLEAAKDVSTVKRVIFISSLSAVIGPLFNCINKTYTEEDWPDMCSLPLKCRGKLNVCRTFFYHNIIFELYTCIVSWAHIMT